MTWHSGWGWGSWFLMIVVMVIFWAAVIVLVLGAIRYLARRDTTAVQQPDSLFARARAEDLLTEAFGRGEMDEDEYRRRLTLLVERR